MKKNLANPNIVPFDRTVLLDDRLSMSARGVLATLIASNKEVGNKFIYDNCEALKELIDCGYIKESFVNSERILDVFEKPQRKRSRNKGGEGYVKILQNALGVKWNTKLFCVHHIDHDHSNNGLNNLLLIPKRLHNKYHMLFNICEEKCSRFMSKGLFWGDDGLVESLSSLREVRNDMERLGYMQQYIITQKMINADFDASEYINKHYPEICRKYIKL